MVKLKICYPYRQPAYTGYNPYSFPYNNYSSYSGYSNYGYGIPYGGYSIYGQPLPDYGGPYFGSSGYNSYGSGFGYGTSLYGGNYPNFGSLLAALTLVVIVSIPAIVMAQDMDIHPMGVIIILKDFFTLIPGNVDCTFEFRSTSWLDAEIFNLLREKRYSLCIADADEHPAREIISTAPWGYLRLRRSDYTEGDLEQWMERILSQKWQRRELSFFLSMRKRPKDRKWLYIFMKLRGQRG